MEGFYEEIVSVLKKKKLSKKELNRLKTKLSKKYGLRKIPTDADIILNADPEYAEKLELITKPTRTLSGVAPIALMTRPHKCPHGTCIYCPGGPGSIFGDVPQSYTGREPSTMRSARNHYDPYLVVFNRLEQFFILNQNPEKTEIIIQGGTFPSLDDKYKEEFVMYVFKAMNDFSDKFYKNNKFDFVSFKKFFELPGDIKDAERTSRVQQKVLKLKKSSGLEKEKKRNESSRIRCVGLTIETKPDWGLLKQGNEMLEYGCTRVELGVQATDDRIQRFTNRGHGIKETVESTRILKDLGFKINYHMMPGLPLSSPEKDLEMLRETIENPDFKPDMFKIYPTMVLKGTALYRMWQKGKYLPMTRETAAEIISEFKRYIPRWVRIMRVQRDIPTYVTEAGVDRTNLRQYVEEKLRQKKIACRCIRCREAGLVSRKENISKIIPELFVEEYEASRGREFFISFESRDRKVLFGYCRLRFPSQFLRKEITEGSALLRELHVVGTATGIGGEGNVQHRGMGKKLLEKAEKIALENGKSKMVVISGVGVREYYRKLGYKRQGPYMAKLL
ncbi:Histone acetyltransferase Elp3 like protein [archaeon GW2011_AR15]|nr:Histone acetyltransferase Elp3 like protein [archaeon GW2011_AR15]MBS3104356.1 tRNA uridine(34) 5-carboxymethylaminomethyl modification radical SAM/GNAT enzyme Elp3 [Candidatus Woesearchaeota archaeon]